MENFTDSRFSDEETLVLGERRVEDTLMPSTMPCFSSRRAPNIKRRKMNEIPSEGERAGISIRVEQGNIPETAIKYFQCWTESRPGAVPEPDEIVAFAALTKLPYGQVHRWFFNKSKSFQIRRDEQASVNETDAAHKVRSLSPTSVDNDTSARHVQDSCSQASQHYYGRRDKCSRRLSEAQKQHNRHRPHDHDRPYFCTSLGGKTFRFKSEWIQHERINRPQEGWVCNLGETWSDEKGLRCSLCDRSNLSPGHFKREHRGKVPCDAKALFDGNSGRVFLRRDKMKEHLKRYHGHLETEQVFNDWKFQVHGNYEKQCGFCGREFTSWEQRNDCVARHFQAKETMKSWHNGPIEGSRCLYETEAQGAEDLRSSAGERSESNAAKDDIWSDNNGKRLRHGRNDHNSDSDQENPEDDSEDDSSSEDSSSDDEDDEDGNDKNGLNSNDGSGNGNSSQHGTDRDDMHDDSGNDYHGDFHNDGDMYAPDSTYFDYDAYQHSLATYQVLKHILLGASTGEHVSSTFSFQIQQQVVQFFSRLPVPNTSVLFSLDPNRSKLFVDAITPRRLVQQ